MKVASFNVNHDKMLKGIYVSRKDSVSDSIITTFDIRMKKPNKEPVLDNASIHTLEHLFAVFLRSNEKYENDIIYVGPMGCRTGMYLILKGDKNPKDILTMINEMFLYVINFDQDVPAATSKECGNFLDHNINFAKFEAKKFYDEVLSCIKDENMVYPN